MQLKEAQQIFTDNIDKILDHFKVDLADRGPYMKGPCPIHGGDNPDGFSISIRDGLLTWKCFTNECHDNYKAPGVIQLVQALLQRDNPQAEFSDALRYGLHMLGIEGVKSQVDLSVNHEKRNMVRWNAEIPFELPQNLGIREKVLEKLNIPSYYYVDRGFSPEILTEYDIGTSKENSGRFYNRSVVPIYNLEHTHVVGAAGRALTDEMEPKWLYDKQFAANNYFFNVWKAKPVVEETGTVVLVEGQMDCVKFAEAGIYNTLGIFGTAISINQIRILNMIGAKRVILSLDNDKAGQKGTTKIFNKLQRYFNLSIAKWPKEVGDPGEATLDQIQECYNKEI